MEYGNWYRAEVKQLLSVIINAKTAAHSAVLNLKQQLSRALSIK
jgi:hypothetical protein